MSSTSQLFQNNLDVVFFVYGLAFVIMGITILVQPKRYSGFKIADTLWLLAAFGIIHGINEFFDMWVIIKGANRTLDIVRWLFLTSSFVLLFEFGRRLLRIHSDNDSGFRITRYLGWWLIIPIAVVIIAATFLSDEGWKTGSIFARYLLGFPAGIMIALGSHRYYAREKAILEPLGVKKFFFLLSATFLTYGILSGLMVPKSGFFPASHINAEAFLSLVHIPVQLFRALCALAGAVAAGGIVTIFNWERSRLIKNALVTREKITEGIDEGILLINRNFEVIWANKKETESYGDKVVGSLCYSATHNRRNICQPPLDPCPIITVMQTGKPSRFVHTHTDKTGNQFYVEVTAYPIRDADGTITEFVHVSRDVTEKTKLEETIKSIGNPLIVLTSNLRVSSVNSILLDITGYDDAELIDKDVGTIFVDQELFSQLGSETQSGLDSLHVPETEIIGRGNVRIPVSVDCSLVKYRERIFGLVCILKDLRGIKQLQEQLIRSERISAVGQLAGGIAHDFNNLLAVIQGNTELALMDINADSPVYQSLKSIHSAANSAADLTRKLLIFGRRQPIRLTLFNVNNTVDKLLKMLKRVVSENIAIKTNLKPDIWAIRADEGNIEQVIMNLTINARDAMPQGGTLTITTDNLSISAGQETSVSPQAEAGNFVCLSISDTGIGMDKDILQHLFEPFFTTKEKGNGLGLPVVYGIVKQLHGWIDVASRPGQGSTFKVCLPAIAEKVTKETSQVIQPPQIRDSGKRILVVEDEKELREFIETLLRKKGYTVVSAANIREAREIFDRERGEFHLLFSDIVLPDGNGLELATELTGRKPGLGVLLSSGYIFDNIQSEKITKGGFKFLPKPYALAEMFQLIQEALDQSAGK